ncbi:WxL protein peptidoglycan domain-containing protein [Phytohabitans aurantiacus]|uniref:DUF916 domain-containing protein n=1 Tax=Phytohabitans aurantiacus TaxID=3016789 RepID=A0ABQ5QQR7_9ACTN|nr:DUF916 domain-containing protein [Phytohabitans aurantiacus]GLH96955.1 hypothetical protein Pa4123_22290 [Phytohabitans aurantiacus]
MVLSKRWGAAVAIALAVVAAVPLVGATAASADDGFTWAVQPSSKDGPTGRAYFVYEAAPGQRVDDRVAITNLGTASMTFAVYGADAFTTADGSFTLQPASQPPVGAGAWVAFEARTYEVPAGRRVVIPFRLTVPANATPGDHAGGVVVSVAQAQESGGQRVNVDRRVAARVYLRVAGPTRPAVAVEAMKVGYDNPLNPVGTAPVVVSYRLRNTGNVRLSGTARARVTAPFGLRLAASDGAPVPELLPGSAITITEQFNGIVPAGHLDVRVDVESTTVDGALPAVTRSSGVWAVPWAWVFLFVAVAGWFAVRRWRARARRRRAA